MKIKDAGSGPAHPNVAGLCPLARQGVIQISQLATSSFTKTDVPSGTGARECLRRAGRGLLFALACLLLTQARVVEAQAPAASPLRAQQAGVDGAAPDGGAAEKSLPDRIESVRERVRETRLRRQVFDDPGYSPPAGITRREMDIVLTYGDRLVMFWESALRSLEAQQQISAELQAFGATAAAWRAFDAPAPYSILLVDELNEQVAFQRRKRDSVLERIAASERLIEEFRAARTDADKTARSMAEDSEADSANPAAEWRWKSAVLHVESIDAFIAWSVAELARVKRERELAEARIGLLERQLETARANCAYSKQDLAEAQSKLDRQTQELEERFTTAAAENKRLGRQLLLAQQAVDEARHALSSGAPGAADVLATAEDRLRVVNAQSDSARARGELFTVEIASLREFREAWAVRFTLLNDGSVLAREAAAKRLKMMLERASALVANGRADVESFKAEEEASADRLASLEGATAAADREREVVDAVRAKLRVAEHQQRTVEGGVQSIQRWLEDANVDIREDAVAGRVRHRGAEFLLLLQRMWQLELFSIEDKMEIGGETVAVARPVTVRKVVTVALWIAFGLWLSSFVTRLAHHALIEHYEVGPAQAKVLRRWISALNLLVLLLIGLYLVRIPLTAFAFLGGALAIGFGFGTQTLIKNLVSGVLMLLERQIRAGDIVEIEGIVGTVEAVDVRSTRVRNFDGKETVIPNSVFLDSNVTNWTLSTSQLRLSIEVGVAYGSPTRRVADLLVQCADSHGQVLKEPAPFVYFQAFGENALLFQLYFWVKIGGGVVGATVASDLRFMIEKALAEAGIVVPRPQRELRFDASHAVRVIVEPRGDA